MRNPLKPDVLLLHAPSVYDFRKRSILFGPVSDVVPSTPIFEMYPVGFTSLAEHLEKYKLKVRIINLAYLMLKSNDYDVEAQIAKMDPKVFGIDLHWLPHAHGSLEIAALCKKYHPNTPVVFGGYSSTYFHRELIEYSQVDYVVKGDSTEEPFRLLVNALIKKDEIKYLPNLTYKTSDNKIISNDITYQPKVLNEFTNNYIKMMKLALLNMDIKGITAIHDWWEYPITAVMTCRGCTQNCIICGASQPALAGYDSRTRPSYRPAEMIVEDVYKVSKLLRGPIFLIGDLRQSGDDYAEQILKGLKKKKIQNEIVMEFFDTAPKDYFDLVSECLPKFNFEISPESHDEEVRFAAGKKYTNKELENNIKWAINKGCAKFDIFFMTGMPKQTFKSVLDTVEYSNSLMNRFGKYVDPFISPLAPFLDPGSIAFENPEEHGYKILFKNLEDYRNALTQPSWKYMMNYETDWMTRDEIAKSTYLAARKLSRYKYQHKRIDKNTYNNVVSKIDLALNNMGVIDEIYKMEEGTKKEQKLEQLKLKMNKQSISTVCSEDEIKWPVIGKGFRVFNIMKEVLFG